VTPTPTPTPLPPAPALVQMENGSDSYPHAGVQAANIAFEYLTEGGITRLTIIYFDPHGTAKVEPLRSTRLITLRLQKAYQGVIVTSGASDHVLGLLNQGHVPVVREGLFNQLEARDAARPAPHNLYTTGDWMAEAVRDYGLHRDYPLLPPSAPSQPAAGPATRISFQMTYAHRVTFTYSAASKTYSYSSESGVFGDADTGQPVSIANVVLLQVAHHDAGYTEDVLGANGIDFDLQGTGPADLYTGGLHYGARWDLSDPNHPLRLEAPDGTLLSLNDGLTWYCLVDPGAAVQSS
jgi:hypothetical protein